MPDDAIARARECLALQWEKAGRPGAAYITRHEPDEITEIHVAAMLAFASQQAPEGWAPIAEAPNDAREMLGWAEGCGFEVVRVDSSGKCYAGAFDADWVKFVRPLPAPPAMLDAAPSVTLGEVG